MDTPPEESNIEPVPVSGSDSVDDESQLQQADSTADQADSNVSQPIPEQEPENNDDVVDPEVSHDVDSGSMHSESVDMEIEGDAIRISQFFQIQMEIFIKMEMVMLHSFAKHWLIYLSNLRLTVWLSCTKNWKKMVQKYQALTRLHLILREISLLIISVILIFIPSVQKPVWQVGFQAYLLGLVKGPKSFQNKFSLSCYQE